MQDGSEDDSDEESDSETPAPEALARYLAIRRYTAIGGANVTTGALSAGMKTFHGTIDGFLATLSSMLFCSLPSIFFALHSSLFDAKLFWVFPHSVFLVYVVLCLIVFGCQYQCSRLPGKTPL